MKWVGIALLWVVAIGIALLLIVRFGRRRKIVLRGRWAPRLARLVVVVLVALGASAEDVRGEDDPKEPNNVGQPQSQAPELLNRKTIALWRRATAGLERFKRAYALWRSDPTARPSPVTKPGRSHIGLLMLPPRIRSLLTDEAAALGTGAALPTVPAGTLLAALADAESRGFIDAWVCAFVWRWIEADEAPRDAADRALTIQLLRRLHRHARLANCLVRAKAEVKPVDIAPRVWASKGGPKRDVRLREEKARQELLVAARRLWSKSDAGPWEREALVGLQVAEGSSAARVVRAETGGTTAFGPGAKLRLTRLDLLLAPEGGAPLALRHTWLGEIQIAPGEALRSWDLAARLGKPAAASLARAVEEALEGDEAAAALLESALPLAHRAIAKGLGKRPKAAGAARLRLILALYRS